MIQASAHTDTVWGFSGEQVKCTCTVTQVVGLSVPRRLYKHTLCTAALIRQSCVCLCVRLAKKKHRKCLRWGQISLALLKHCFCQSCFYSLTWKLNLSTLCKRIFFSPLCHFFFLNIMRVIIYVQNKQCNFICISGRRMLTPVKFRKRNFFIPPLCSRRIFLLDQQEPCTFERLPAIIRELTGKKKNNKKKSVIQPCMAK